MAQLPHALSERGLVQLFVYVDIGLVEPHHRDFRPGVHIRDGVVIGL